MARKKAAAEVAPMLIDESKPAAVWMDLDKLRNWKNNPKKHTTPDIAAIAKSIQTFGWGEPILAREEDNEIIAGHGRVLAADQLGIKRGPVRLMSLSERLAHGLALADNKVAEGSRWDKELLPIVLEEQRVDVRVFEATGFSYEDWFPEDKPAVDEDALPDAPKEPIVKEGDMWRCGQHVVVCGDCHRPEVLALALKPSSVDLVVTDPPYANYGTSTGIGADIADDKMVRPFFERTFMIIGEHVKEFGHVYVCCDWRSWARIWESANRAQIVPKNMIVWDKGDQGMGSMYQQCHELVYFGARTPPPKSMRSTTKKGTRMVRGKSNVFRANRPSGEERQHNAAKPVAMIRYFIENSSDEGDLVVDFFGGSGTTMIACEQTKRRCIVFDIKASECDKMILRWEKVAGAKARKVGK